MKKHITGLLSAVLAAITCAGCAQGSMPHAALALPVKAEPVSVASSGKPDDRFFDASFDFAAGLFRAACLKDTDNGINVLISPESAALALAMAANGAAGDTQSQMLGAICGGMSADELNDALLYMQERAASSDKASFRTANSVWARDTEGFKLKQPFVDTAKAYYNADCFVEPFDGGTADKINDWVNTATNGMIPDIVNEIDESAMTFLINAISFESEWDSQYDTRDVRENEIFTNSLGEKEHAVMLYSEEKCFMSDDDSTAFMKYYKGREYAFMGILPDEGISLADYVAEFDGEKLRRLWNSRTYGKTVYARFPEFTYDNCRALRDTLVSLGMELPFAHDADFSEMAEFSDPSGSLQISGVIQKTFIQVDRSGTRATAATAATNAAAAAIGDEPVVIKLDRPFVYAIVDTESGYPVFIGAVSSIAG